MQTNYKLFQNIGKLFYAVSASDGHIHELEIKQLKQLVKYKWLALDEIDGMQAASEIESTFDWLVQQSADYESCFTDFEHYQKKHPEQFSKPIIKLTLNTAYAIAKVLQRNATES